VKFRILGPLDLANGAGPVSVDAPKQRALLGVLLLHPNEAVSSERLIDELWGERPPPTATKVLQTYVSQLRRVIGADAIATRPPGYLLRVDEEALDATQFRHLFAEGRRLASNGDHAGASARYREALALWRGPPLADVVFESFARNEVERLEEERLSTLMDLIDCELALGEHEEVVQELEALVRQHPLRERLRAQLMLALYRSGRQADALAAYQDGRRTLVEELGLEPGHELQELEKAVLVHDPALDAPTSRVEALRHARQAFRWRAAALVVAIGIALALGLALGLGGRHEPSLGLEPNSVGFIDATSGRLTRSFAVGRAPQALELTRDSVWVANFRDRTVTRFRRDTGRSATIPIGGHPTALVASDGTVWVLTLEGTLVPIDPRYDTSGRPVALGIRVFVGSSPADGRIAAGGGYLWVTAPGTMVIRIDPANPRRPLRITPDSGARGPIVFHDGEAWVAGSGGDVFPIEARSGVPGDPISVGGVRGLAFGAGSLWVVSGGPGHIGGVRQALRRVDTESRLVQTTIPVGSDPVGVAFGAGSIWVASRSDRQIKRVDADQNRVVDSLPIGSAPIALAADENGVWVATG
jgi:DNA-binding SARP family transcriptional activator/DNA-binding beta-propeller fold protein YncE